VEASELNSCGAFPFFCLIMSNTARLTEKTALGLKCVFRFSPQSMLETFLSGKYLASHSLVSLKIPAETQVFSQRFSWRRYVRV
jgi:hypothetical protein